MANGRKTGGRSWEKGQSGNPGGRPAAVKDVRDAAREATQDALAVLQACLGAADSTWRDKIAAATVLLDRAWGKPSQAVTDADGGSLARPLSNAELDALFIEKFGSPPQGKKQPSDDVQPE